MPPIVDPNYFGDERDLRTLVAALRVARRSVPQARTTHGAARKSYPGPDADDDEALVDFAKAAYQSYFHPVGTCAMGDTDMSVVDSELRVHGISGLRVAEGPSCRRSRRPTRPRRSMRSPNGRQS